MSSVVEGSEQSLKKRAIHGVKWTGASAVFGKAISLVKTPVLARLLAPADFGLLGMLQTVLMFSNPLAGMGGAVIQKKDINHVQLSTLYWLNLLVGLVIFTVLLLIGPLVASFYNEERLEHLMIFVAFIFLTRPLGSQFQKLMEKNLDFGLTVKIEMLANVVNFVVTVVLACMGWGVYSLLYGRLSSSILTSVLLIFYGLRIHRPGFHFNLRESKDLLSFGGYQMGERFLKIFAANLDKLLIGKFLGAEILGYYTIAHTLIIIPLFTINPLVTKVSFPVFSIIQDNMEKMNSYFSKAINLLVTLNFPIYFGMMITAPDFVPLIFGEKWTASVAVIQILSLEALLWTISNPVGSVLLAKGRADLSFKLNVVRSCCLALSVLTAYALYPSIESVAIGIVTSRYLVDPFIHRFMAKNYGINYGRILKNILTISAVSLGMVLTVCLVETLGIENDYVDLALKVLLGGMTYALLLALFSKESKDLLLSLRRS